MAIEFPHPKEVKAAAEAFGRINFKYHGLLRRHPVLLVGLHQAHSAGNFSEGELRELGKNFANLLARLPEKQKPAMLKQLDTVFERSHGLLARRDYMGAINFLLKTTANRDALDIATKGRLRVTAKKLSRWPGAVFSNLRIRVRAKPQPKPKAPKVDAKLAIEALQSIGMRYPGLLSKRPALAVALRSAHLEGTVYSAELVALGSRFSALLRGKTGPEKKVVLAKLDNLFAGLEKQLTQQGKLPYSAFSRLMQHTESEEALNSFTKSRARRYVEKLASRMRSQRGGV